MEAGCPRWGLVHTPPPPAPARWDVRVDQLPLVWKVAAGSRGRGRDAASWAALADFATGLAQGRGQQWLADSVDLFGG